MSFLCIYALRDHVTDFYLVLETAPKVARVMRKVYGKCELL